MHNRLYLYIIKHCLFKINKKIIFCHVLTLFLVS